MMNLRKHYAKQKKQEHILYTSIYMTFLEKANLQRKPADQCLPEMGWEQRLTVNGHEKSYWGIRDFFETHLW